MIREAETGTGLPSPIYQNVPVGAIRDRAERFGFRVEEFRLGIDGMTPKRMDQILAARGICGSSSSPRSPPTCR